MSKDLRCIYIGGFLFNKIICPNVWTIKILSLYCDKLIIMKRKIKLTVWEFTNDRGVTDILTLDARQYAGLMRRKGYKKSIISKRKLFTLSIDLKSHLK